jgi:spore coat protein CotH
MKNITIYKIIIAIYFTLIFVPAKSQNFYDVNTIQEIEIQFSQANWDYILDSLKNSTEDYLMADWVKINGVQYDSAGVKFKGNSSYDSLNSKNPLNISLDKFKRKKLKCKMRI